jgi:predicted nucleic acid-binding Zn ribbon protein
VKKIGDLIGGHDVRGREWTVRDHSPNHQDERVPHDQIAVTGTYNRAVIKTSTKAQLADDARALKALRAGRKPPVRCSRCKRLTTGTVYLRGNGAACQACSVDLFAGERWKLRVEPCEICGREIAKLGWMHWPGGKERVCSEWCRHERWKASRRVTHEPQPCIVCGEEFAPSRSDARTCSARCRQRLRRARALH